MKQFKSTSKCKKQFHFQKKNFINESKKFIFMSHFETHAYTLWQAGCRAGWMGKAGLLGQADFGTY